MQLMKIKNKCSIFPINPFIFKLVNIIMFYALRAKDCQAPFQKLSDVGYCE